MQLSLKSLSMDSVDPHGQLTVVTEWAIGAGVFGRRPYPVASNSHLQACCLLWV